jgi:hypothetical protein
MVLARPVADATRRTFVRWMLLVAAAGRAAELDPQSRARLRIRRAARADGGAALRGVARP